jgi:hypothetical protein
MATQYLGMTLPDALATNQRDIDAYIAADEAIVEQALRGLAASGANLLINPGMEINQRRLSSYSGAGVYTLDRWQTSYTGAVTLTVSPETTVVDALSKQSACCVFVKGAGSAATLEQLVEGGSIYQGQAVTLRWRVKCSTANAVRLIASDGVTSASGAYHTGDGSWQTLTLTMTLNVAATLLIVGVQFTASCTAYVDNTGLALGSTPLPYAPLLAGEDLRRCERYYEVHGGANGYPYVRGYSAVGTGDIHTLGIAWRKQKGAAPTVTKTGTWTVNNAGQPSVTGANTDGYSLSISSLVAGYFDTTPNSSDDLIIAEWNPTT